MLFAMPDAAKTPADLVRLWLHEASRVYQDKLTDIADLDTFNKTAEDIVKKNFEVW